MFFGVTVVVALAASMALHVRRWHDQDKSGWLALTWLIPVVAALVSVIELGFERSKIKRISSRWLCPSSPW